MARIWAVARHTIAEAIRLRIAIVFMIVIHLVLVVTPFTVEGDGVTLKTRVQAYLNWSLSLVGFFLGLLTVFTACGALADEISQKQILMIVTKPVPRWQIWTGKWLGIAALNAVLLAVTGFAVWGFTWYLSTRPSSLPDKAAREADKTSLQEEVLTARHGTAPRMPNFDADVDQFIRQMREQGKIENLNADELQKLRESKLAELQSAWKLLKAQEWREYEFPNLLVDRRKQAFVELQFMPFTPTGVDGVKLNAVYSAGDPTERDTLTPVHQREFVCERFHTIEIPNYAVNSRGTLYLRVINVNERDDIEFTDRDSGEFRMELLLDIGSFHWNLFRALVMVWCCLAFLAAMGLAASSFLSFPVAVLACILVMLAALIAGFLGDAVGYLEPSPLGEDPLWLFGPLVRGGVRAFLWILPNVWNYIPVNNVVTGRVVTLKWVTVAIVDLVFIRAAVLAVLGCVVLTKREIAQVTA